ncbi:hypothetical protein [Pseudomonas chlororaphis]|nr:hypothetical protein [Pseudomonas chlororaphis]
MIPPASINARANIAALRSVGCTQLLSVSAVGSLTPTRLQAVLC